MPAPKQNAILVFGENDNDRSSLVAIAQAISPSAVVRYEKRHKPLVLVSAAEKRDTIRSTVDEIYYLVKIAKVRFNVIAIIAHRDCDAVEPAHERLAASIKTSLANVGVPTVIAATPAFELEAWWLLFPEAAEAVCPNWEKFTYRGGNVGMIVNAKEHLRKILRPKEAKKRKRVPDYSESDSVRLAEMIKKMDIVRRVAQHQCGSLYNFIVDIDTLFAQ